MVLSLDSIFSQYPILLNIIPIVILIFISYVAFKFSRILLIKILIPQIKKSKTQLDDSFIKNKLFISIGLKNEFFEKLARQIFKGEIEELTLNASGETYISDR